MKPIRLLSGVVTVGFWTMLSRVLGLVREILITALIGPGPVMDAFVAAFRLPNMFRRFFAEGAFNAAFVPMISKKLEAEEDTRAFARNALSWLATITLVLTALAMIFMPLFVWATAAGFAGDERFDMTVEYGRIMFPYIVCMSLAALFSGVLNATGRFAVAAAAPTLLNIFVVAALLVGYATGGSVITWLIWTIPVAGVAQLALTWRAASAAIGPLRPHLPKPNSDMLVLLKTAVPAALASGVIQINLIVGQLVASQFEGAVSWLFAADRLYQLPLGVIGIAVGIVLLPDLSRRLQAKDDAGAQTALSRAAEFALFLTIPSAVALVIIPLPLVSVLFERGATDSDDAAAIAVATTIYGLGLPAFVLQKIQQPLFFARGDTRRPFHYAVVSMVLNAALAFGLAPSLGWVAPAIATTVSGWSMVLLLWLGSRSMGEVARFDKRLRQRLWRICVAAGVMGGGLWLANVTLTPALGTPGIRYLALLALIASGAALYFAAAHVLRALRLGEVRAAMRRSG